MTFSRQPDLSKSTDFELLDLAEMVAARLERLSADSGWARRASGLRGALLETIAAYRAEDEPQRPIPSYGLRFLLERGLYILKQAGIELIR